jgi:SAM-dependent methyltransferase
MVGLKSLCIVPLMLEALYGKELKKNEPGSARSADVVVPLVMQLVAPSSVVDVGCGLASWLAAFAHFGVPRIFGVDGPWVDESTLRIPPDRFLAADLTRPLRLDEHFDLVVSLEVGEHLPADAADTFIDSLVALGPVVLFSAAVPGQGGVGHVNEQWPDYWVGRFAERGFGVVDCIRPRIWSDERVEFWYAQNTLIFANDEGHERHPVLNGVGANGPVSVVHPQLLAKATKRRPAPPGVRELLREFPHAVARRMR